ncbi:MAG TPA: hypothetical protein V6C58_15315 [Allocoleopsis sp.]
MEYLKGKGLKSRITQKTPLEFLEKHGDKSAHIVFIHYTDVDSNTAYHIRRVLKAGGLCIVSATTKSIYTCGKDLHENGLPIKDICAWVNPSVQSTSFGMKYIIEHSKDLDEEQKKETLKEFENLRTMKLRNCYTPILICQKAIESMHNLVYNQKKHGCGLMNATRTAYGNLAPNVITTDFIEGYDVPFLIGRIKGSIHTDFYNDQKLRLYYHLLKTFSHAGNVILDCSMDTGGVFYSCILLGDRHYYGNEYIKERYMRVVKGAEGVVKMIPEFEDRFMVAF